MILKEDMMLLLTEMQDNGIDTRQEVGKLLKSQTIPMDVLKFINDNKPLDVLNFYEKVRGSYNNKKSKLYINIMKADENVLDDPRTILTTLSALLNQILQYKCDDKAMFYRHSRADEIVKVLELYFKTYNLEPAMKLLALTKADIKVLEMLK